VDGFDDQTIRIQATSGNPLRAEYAYESAFSLTVEGWDDEPWHHYGSDVQTSGWSDLGGGIYSKTLNYTSIGRPLVTTMTQTIGDRSDWWYKLVPATVATTPGVGEYGYASNVCYVRLPGDADPNGHTIEVPRRNYCWRAIGAGRLTVRDFVHRASIVGNSIVGLSTNPDGTGYMTMEDGLSEYGGTLGGCVMAGGKFESLICRRVEAYRSDNDGFNIKAPVPGGAANLAQLYDCDGSYNGDLVNASAQGASAHESSVMELHGGRYDYNVSGGMVSIDTSINRLIGDGPDGAVYMENNMRLGNTGGTITAQAACAWMDTTTGSVTGPVYVRNNQGVGVRVATVSAVTGLSNIVSTGNGAADVIA
jgi:hypothetical protein